MAIIKNYYDQQKELEIAYLRLKTLEEQKKLYFENTQPGSSKPKETVVQTSYTDYDPFFEFAKRTEEICKQVEILNIEIKLLEKNLKFMEENIRQMKSIEYKVFTYKYIDSLSVRKISTMIGYSEPQTYRILRIIKSIIKER